MRALLIAAAASLAAIAIPAAPAGAQSAGVAAHGDRGHGELRGGDVRDGDRSRGGHRRFRDGLVFLDYGGPRLHREERVDDWWHDKPWRSYPRWIQTNQNCERMWWSGSGWRC